MIRQTLRPSQVLARDAALPVLRDGGGFLLLPEPRVGKTLSTQVISQELKPTHIWIICPKAAIQVWKKAFIDEPDTVPPGQLVITNYEQLVINPKLWYKKIKELRNTDFLMIVDEIHFIKKRGASRSRVVRRLGRSAKWRLGLTGTPIAQGLQDAWAQFDFIDPEVFGPYSDEYLKKGKKYIRTKEGHKIIKREGFDSRYLRWGGFKDHDIIGYVNEEEFQAKFHAHSFRITLRESRRLMGHVPLKLRYSIHRFKLWHKTREIYEDLKNDLVAEVNRKKVKIKNVLGAIVKLQQLTGGFLLDIERDPETNEILSKTRHRVGREKLRALRKRLEEIEGRFIVIARFIHEIEAVEKYLRFLGYTTAVVRGGQPYDGKFACDCVIMQIQSGIAVDMSAADTIIFYSTDYSYLNFEQSRFRVLSHEKPNARFIFLIAEDSVDESIYLAVTRKKNLAKLVIDTYRTRSKANG